MSNIEQALLTKYQEARDNLKDNPDGWDDFDMFKAGHKSALAEIGKCEPVGWYIKAYFSGSDTENTWTYSEHKYDLEYATKRGLEIELRYSYPPQQREWVSLDFNDIAELIDDKHEFAKTISEKLKQLNTEG